jgi:hypothetical protein
MPAVAFAPQTGHTPPNPIGPPTMPSKPNYNHQRAERDRAKKASRDLKLQERKQQAALRKEAEAGNPAPADDLPPDSGE